MLSILQLKVLKPFCDRRQHILSLIIKDRASLHFFKHCDYLFETHVFLFQHVNLVIAPVIIGNFFDLMTFNFWILNCFNAVFFDPLNSRILNSWIIGSDAGTFLPKLAHFAADTSVVNSFTRASNYKSSSSSTSISSLSPLMLCFLKRF